MATLMSWFYPQKVYSLNFSEAPMIMRPSTRAADDPSCVRSSPAHRFMDHVGAGAGILRHPHAEFMKSDDALSAHCYPISSAPRSKWMRLS